MLIELTNGNTIHAIKIIGFGSLALRAITKETPQESIIIYYNVITQIVTE